MTTLTKDQIVWGDREAMLVDDRVSVVLQQFPCVLPIEIIIFYVNPGPHICGDR